MSSRRSPGDRRRERLLDLRSTVCILPAMRKHTTVDLDQELVRKAAAVLGTSRIVDTLHAALADVVARRKRAWLARYPLTDLTPEALGKMRQTRDFDDSKVEALA